MELIEAMSTCRAIRRFRPDPVPVEIVDRVPASSDVCAIGFERASVAILRPAIDRSSHAPGSRVPEGLAGHGGDLRHRASGAE